MLRFPFQATPSKVAAALLAAALLPAHAQVITPAPKAPTPSTSAQTTSVQPSTGNQANAITEAQAASLNAEAKQNTGKACVATARSMHWAQKPLATASGTVGNVLPMPAPAAPVASPQLQVAEQFLAALEKLTGDYSSVVKLGHTQSGKWALVRDRDNLTNIYFAVSQGNGQMVVKFCELQ